MLNHRSMKNCIRNIYMNGKLHMLIFPGSCYQIVIRCGETYCPGSMNLLKQYYILRRNFIKPLLLQLHAFIGWTFFLCLASAYYRSDGNYLAAEAVFICSFRTKTQLMLPDGTKVWMNSDSKLTYPVDFSKKRRLVKLEGEAYFDVVHDENNKFIVNTGTVNELVARYQVFQ